MNIHTVLVSTHCVPHCATDKRKCVPSVPWKRRIKIIVTYNNHCFCKSELEDVSRIGRMSFRAVMMSSNWVRLSFGGTVESLATSNKDCLSCIRCSSCWEFVVMVAEEEKDTKSNIPWNQFWDGGFTDDEDFMEKEWAVSTRTSRMRVIPIRVKQNTILSNKVVWINTNVDR